MRILREPLFGAKRYSAFSVVTFECLCRNYIKQRRFAAVKGTERPFFYGKMSGTAVIFASYFCMRRFYFVIYVLQEDK